MGFTIYGRCGHLGHLTRMPRTNFRPPTQGSSTQNLALIGQAVSEKMFEIVDDVRRQRRRTTDGTAEHGYTISSPMSLRLR